MHREHASSQLHIAAQRYTNTVQQQNDLLKTAYLQASQNEKNVHFSVP